MQEENQSDYLWVAVNRDSLLGKSEIGVTVYSESNRTLHIKGKGLLGNSCIPFHLSFILFE